MPALDLEGSSSAPKKSKNKYLKIILGISALVAVPVVGTTLAASITLNSNDAIQFGQGQVQATVCDTTVTVTTDSEYENAATNTDGVFNLGDVTLTGIDDDCDEKLFTVSVYDGTASSDPLIVCGGVEMDISLGGGAGGGACTSGDTSVQYTITNASDDQTLTVQFGGATTPISSEDVYKVTVETS
jgi:hypothetical protein